VDGVAQLASGFLQLAGRLDYGLGQLVLLLLQFRSSFNLVCLGSVSLGLPVAHGAGWRDLREAGTLALESSHSAAEGLGGMNRVPLVSTLHGSERMHEFDLRDPACVVVAESPEDAF